MSDAGLSCGLDAPSKKAEAAKALAEQLKDHNEEIAKCASKLILADTTTLSESGEDDKDKDSSEDKQEKGKSKGKKGKTIMWNETARMLSIIGVAASVLLHLQILVLAMA
ncbi:hypothetical protein OESDEN_18785, partial [Oesophagostomum dentatum]